SCAFKRCNVLPIKSVMCSSPLATELAWEPSASGQTQVPVHERSCCLPVGGQIGDASVLRPLLAHQRFAGLNVVPLIDRAMQRGQMGSRMRRGSGALHKPHDGSPNVKQASATRRSRATKREPRPLAKHRLSKRWGVEAARPTLPRARLSTKLTYRTSHPLEVRLGNIGRCLLAMRSLSMAMTWTRRVEACGHDVRWMAAKYVRPVCRSQRNGFNDQQAMPRPSHGPNP